MSQARGLSQRKALSNAHPRKLDFLSSPAILQQEFISVSSLWSFTPPPSLISSKHTAVGLPLQGSPLRAATQAYNVPEPIILELPPTRRHSYMLLFKSHSNNV